MSTFSERVATIGDIRDFMSSPLMHFDELRDEEKTGILAAVDTVIARALLDEPSPHHPNNFPLRRCHVDMWTDEFYIAGTIPAYVSASDVGRAYYGDMNVSRSLFDAIVNYILHEDVEMRLWIVAVPVDAYVEHVRETCGEKCAERLAAVTDAELEKVRTQKKISLREQMLFDRGIAGIYGKIYDDVWKGCMKKYEV